MEAEESDDDEEEDAELLGGADVHWRVLGIAVDRRACQCVTAQNARRVG